MYIKIKRLTDIMLSAVLLCLLLPVMVLFAILIAINMGTPVFFVQQRIGLNNKAFNLYKFRSMRAKTAELDVDYKRITVLGRFIRIARIDEFPQLLNILKGDMSFIGPRPLLPEYLPYYTSFELQRHQVRPGLSGLSQVSGSYPTWEQQFENDVKYVHQISFLLDVSLVFRTFKKVLFPTKKLISGKQGRVRFDLYRSSPDKLTLI